MPDLPRRRGRHLRVDALRPHGLEARQGEARRRRQEHEVALVNNAGIGLMGAFEATPMTTVREVFETNTFGVMAMTQAVTGPSRSASSPPSGSRRW
ncbi:SDR family NAD(P)-dependent oxidoreductase [Sorangium sp. So ce854]